MKDIGVEIELNDTNNYNTTMNRTIWNIIKDEFRTIFTDSGAMLLLCFAMMIYTIIYSTAYGNEVVRNVAIAIVDEDNTPSSRNLIKGLIGGPNTSVSKMIPVWEQRNPLPGFKLLPQRRQKLSVSS